MHMVEEQVVITVEGDFRGAQCCGENMQLESLGLCMLGLTNQGLYLKYIPVIVIATLQYQFRAVHYC